MNYFLSVTATGRANSGLKKLIKFVSVKISLILLPDNAATTFFPATDCHLNGSKRGIARDRFQDNKLTVYKNWCGVTCVMELSRENILNKALLYRILMSYSIEIAGKRYSLVDLPEKKIDELEDLRKWIDDFLSRIYASAYKRWTVARSLTVNNDTSFVELTNFISVSAELDFSEKNHKLQQNGVACEVGAFYGNLGEYFKGTIKPDSTQQIYRNRLKKGLIFLVSRLFMYGAVIGVAALTFFFAFQFTLMVGMSVIGFQILFSAIIASFLYICYRSTWGAAIVNLAKAFSDKIGIYTRSSLSLPKETIPGRKMTRGEGIVSDTLLVLGLLAAVVVGLGAYLGIMTVAYSLLQAGYIAAPAVVLFIPWAVACGLCVLVGFGAFCIPKMIKNGLFFYRNRENFEDIAQLEKDRKNGKTVFIKKKEGFYQDYFDKKKRQISQAKVDSFSADKIVILDNDNKPGWWAPIFLFASFAATFGFTLFKSYSTFHFLQLPVVMGTAAVIGNPIVLVAIAIAAISIFILNTFTGGVAIWHARKDLHLSTLTPKTSGERAALFFAGIGTIFNGAAPVVGALGFLAVIPALSNPIGWGIVFGVGLFLGVARAIEFLFFSVPSIKDNLGKDFDSFFRRFSCDKGKDQGKTERCSRDDFTPLLSEKETTGSEKPQTSGARPAGREWRKRTGERQPPADVQAGLAARGPRGGPVLASLETP